MVAIVAAWFLCEVKAAPRLHVVRVDGECLDGGPEAGAEPIAGHHHGRHQAAPGGREPGLRGANGCGVHETEGRAVQGKRGDGGGESVGDGEGGEAVAGTVEQAPPQHRQPRPESPGGGAQQRHPRPLHHHLPQHSIVETSVILFYSL